MTRKFTATMISERCMPQHGVVPHVAQAGADGGDHAAIRAGLLRRREAPHPATEYSVSSDTRKVRGVDRQSDAHAGQAPWRRRPGWRSAGRPSAGATNSATCSRPCTTALAVSRRSPPAICGTIAFWAGKKKPSPSPKTSGKGVQRPDVDDAGQRHRGQQATAIERARRWPPSSRRAARSGRSWRRRPA